MTSLPRRSFSAHNLLCSLRQFISRPLALFSVLLIGAVCLLLAPGVSEGANQIERATARQSAPTHLQGQQALDYLKQQGVYDRLSASVEASSYEVGQATLKDSLPSTLRGRGSDKIYRATNDAQNLSAYFSADQMLLEPLHDGCQTGTQAGLRLRDYGYGDRLIEAGPGLMRVDGNRVEISRQLDGGRSPVSEKADATSHGKITEWYLNTKEGIEHGFTLDAPPGERQVGTPLRLCLGVKGEVRVAAVDDGKGVAFRNGNDDAWLRYDHLVVKDAKGRELGAKFETAGREISLAVDDADAVYPVEIDPLFTQIKEVIASDAAPGDSLGYSAAISGDTMVVGAISKNSSTGAAYIYRRNQGGADNWGEVEKLTASDGASSDGFGYSVSISGDTIVVGAIGKNSSTGAAYIYNRNQGGADNWGEVRKLIASDGASGDRFGSSVSISGDTIVVGAPDKSLSTGAAYVYSHNQGGADNWGELKKLTASDGTTSDNFGQSVAISGDTIVIDAYGKNSTRGESYVYSRNQGGADNWGEVKKLTASDAVGGDHFGSSAAIGGDTIVVSAPGKNSQAGAAYVYSRNQGGADNWGEVKKLTASDGTSGNNFGNSVSISGDTIVVGAYVNNSLTGAAYVYSRNQGGTDNWGEVKKLTASNAASNNQFGSAVAISGNTIVIGADGKNSFMGAAYLFQDQCGGWAQTKEPTASDGAAGDRFGYSVSISGDTIVVGSLTRAAYVYRRNQSGVNNWGEVKKLTASDGGAQFGNSVSINGDTIVVGDYNKDSQRGAAYVYKRNQGGADNWGEVKKLTASDAAAVDFFGQSVSINGDTIVVGAYTKNSFTGAAYIYSRNQGGADNWGEVKKLTASDAAVNNYFGYSVAINGNTIVVSAPSKNSQAGAAYIYSRNQGGVDNWGEVKELTASDAAANDNFGSSVSMSGDTIVVGASGKNSLTGATYVYSRNQGGIDNWGEVRKLTASDGAANNVFGYSVAINGDTIVVGAWDKSSVGAAYVYRRNQGGADNWGVVRELTSSDGAANDRFGISVAIHGDTIVAGAYGPNSQAGASYIFDVACPPVMTNSFGAASIPFNSTTSLTFTITNPNSLTAVTGVGFTDILPAGLTVADSTSSTCNGTLSTISSTGVITLGGATIPVGGTCQFSINVTGTAAGIKPNTTGPVTSNEGGTGTPSNTATLQVNKGDQTITVGTHAPASATYNTQFTVAAASSSGLTVAYSSAGSCTNVGATFTMTSGAGTCTVKYGQAGDSNYNAAPQVTELVTAQKADQTITFGPLSDKTYGDPNFTVSATASSSNAVTFSSQTTGVCTVSGNTVTILSAGSCTIRASQAGDGNYNAAAPVDRSFTVNKASSTTTITISNATYDGQPHGGTATVTGAGGLSQSPTITYTGRNGTVYSSTTAPTNAGDYTANASFGGDSNHSSSNDSKDFTIAKASQTINFAALPDKTYGDVPFTISATGGTSGNSVTFSSLTPTICSASGNTVSITAAGSCTIRASQAGSSNYNAAIDVDRSFNVANAASTTIVTVSNSTYDGNPHGGTATVTGAGGLSQGLTITYTGRNSTVYSSTTAPTNAGDYTASASFAGDTNHNGSNDSKDFTINKATSVITWNNPANIVSGTPLSNTQLNATANVAGTFIYIPPSGTILSVGAHQLSVTFTPTDAVNYATATASVSITIEPVPAALSLDNATYSVSEGDGHVTVTVNRTGGGTGAASVDYKTSDTAGLQNCNVFNGVASSRCDYATTVGTLNFAGGETSKTISIPLVDDSFAEGPESFQLTLSNAQGENLGSISSATITITDNETTAGNNPIATVPFFVRQQYIDFLGREPDPIGFAGWQDILNSCAAGDTSCDRISVSSGFFRSPEFQARGYFIFRFYSAALGRNPTYAEFMPDLAKVSGFLSDAQLEANKVAFVSEFMARSEYVNRYGSLGNAAYVDALLQTAGLPNHPSRGAWIDALNNGSMTRGQVLRALVESQEVYNRFYNQAFVVMQYFGYLRRDPDALYTQWIDQLNQTGDYRMMISGFANSNEYVQRFGP